MKALLSKAKGYLATKPSPGELRTQLEERFELVHNVTVRLTLNADMIHGLLELIGSWPDSEETKVALLIKCWSRCRVTPHMFPFLMLRHLEGKSHPRVAKCIGWERIIDWDRPDLHYTLDLRNPEEHWVAWRLHRIAIATCGERNWFSVKVNGESVRVTEDESMWQTLTSRPDKFDPATLTESLVLDFDFSSTTLIMHTKAALKLQAQWRTYAARKKMQRILLATMIIQRGVRDKVLEIPEKNPAGLKKRHSFSAAHFSKFETSMLGSSLLRRPSLMGSALRGPPVPRNKVRTQSMSLPGGTGIPGYLEASFFPGNRAARLTCVVDDVDGANDDFKIPLHGDNDENNELSEDQ